MSLRIRRGGGTTPPPPPPSGNVGPTLGVQSVRDGAGARAVSSPGTGISFNSSGSLQTAINNNVNDSTFVCSTNTPTWTSAINVGTKNPTIIIPGTPGQAIIDGGGADYIPINGPTGARFTIRGGTWRNFGTTTHGTAMVLRDNCLVEDVIVTDCYEGGFSVQGPDNTISHCTLHANGSDGYSGISGSQRMTLEYCNVYGNNTRNVNVGNQGGAGKIGQCGNGLYHHNWIHDNIGMGGWWDTNAFQWLIEENIFENNHMAGFFNEANYGSTVRHNYIYNNGRNASIGGFPATFENCVNVRLSDSSADRVNPDGQVTPVDFHLNIVDDDGTHGGSTGGLILVWDHSATASRHAANIDVHDNQFWLRTLTNARVRGQDTAPAAYPVWDSDNHFFNNQYRVASPSPLYWQWGTGTEQGSAKTFAAWQGFHPTGETRQLI